MLEVESIIKPKKPKGAGWLYGGAHDTGLGFECHRWYYPDRSIQVLSALEVARDPDDIDKGPEYHVSVSDCSGPRPQRLNRSDTRFVLKAFGMEDADEDNHVPFGVVRNFWMPVNENLQGYVCPCKDEEPAIVEDKGDYVWRGVTR